MKRLVISLLAVMLLLFCVSCDFIPQYQFSTKITYEYIAGRYYYTPSGNASESIFVLNLEKDTSFSLAASGDAEGLLPSSGVYSVDYSGFGITSASGTIHFRNLDTGFSEDVRFEWLADPEEGPLSLYLKFDGGAAIQCLYGGRT